MQHAEQEMWVLLAQQGDESALLKLYQCFQPALLQFAFRLTRERSSAHDAVQTAWLKVLQNLRRLEEPAAFKSWLYRGVQWAATDWLRQRSIEESRFSSSQSDELSAQEKPVSHGLDALLQQLPAEEYQAVYLFYYAQLQVREIALVQAVPVATVKTRLFRGRAKLKNLMENEI
jgi:RNA polymerase sigma factor (sigma-70 family)